MANLLQRQEQGLSFVKQEQWTEDQVKGLPSGEHDYFERKSGALFDDRNNLYDTLAKAASAFANSGGGHLILGATDEGAFDGVPTLITGRITTRDWLEQKLPDLLDYRLADFRVHTVLRSKPSSIPEGRELIVIDIGDSALAPHQSRRQTTYFYRSGGRSLPAPHFYLELLRQRLTNPCLEFELESVRVHDAWQHEGSLMLRIETCFLIKNTGRIAAYKWSLARRRASVPDNRSGDYFFTGTPGAPGYSTGISLDDTILPGCECQKKQAFDVRLCPMTTKEQVIRGELAPMLQIVLTLQLATESSPGEFKDVALGPFISVDEAVEFLKSKGFVAADPAC